MSDFWYRWLVFRLFVRPLNLSIIIIYSIIFISIPSILWGLYTNSFLFGCAVFFTLLAFLVIRILSRDINTLLDAYSDLMLR